MTKSGEGKKSTPRLGRGLSALIGELDAVGTGEGDGATTADPVPAEIPSSEISIDLISPNPKQPRRLFGETELAELSESIAKRGVLQPILLRPDPKDLAKYQIIAGERRWRASKRAGLTSIPAVVREFNEVEVLEIGIIENVQREDLNPIEEAEAYQALIDRFGRTQESVSEIVGKSRAHVANTLRLLKLPERSLEYVKTGSISAGHARAALSSDNPDEIVDKIMKLGLSVREAERLAQSEKPISGEPKLRKISADDSKDVDTQALEADISRTLGLSVDIRHKASGGELRIRYRDLEQLDDLCRRLTKPG